MSVRFQLLFHLHRVVHLRNFMVGLLNYYTNYRTHKKFIKFICVQKLV